MFSPITDQEHIARSFPPRTAGRYVDRICQTPPLGMSSPKHVTAQHGSVTNVQCKSTPVRPSDEASALRVYSIVGFSSFRVALLSCSAEAHRLAVIEWVADSQGVECCRKTCLQTMYKGGISLRSIGRLLLEREANWAGPSTQ